MHCLRLTPIRADQIARTGEILEQVCTHLHNSDIVIADLTGGNPNVMYELGLRHTTGKLTIQLGEKDRLPFDISAIRTIMFRRTQAGLVRARKELSEALSAGISGGGDHVTATRVWLREAPSADEVPDHETADTPGFLEKLADLEEHVGRLPRLIRDVGDVMDAMHALTAETTQRMDKANRSGAPASARLHLANELATALEPHSDRLKDISISYELAVQGVDPGVRYMLSLPMENLNSAEREALLQNVRNAVDSVEKYIDSMSGLSEQLQATGEATRSFRRVSGRTRAAVSRLIRSSQQLLEWRSLS